MKKILFCLALLTFAASVTGREVVEIQVDGNTRKYTFYFPEGHSDARPAQLVVMLHGMGQTMDDYLPAATGQQLANTYDCAILVPQAMAEQDGEINNLANFIGTSYPMVSTEALAHVWNAGASASMNDIKASLGANAALFDWLAPNLCPNALSAGKVQLQAGIDDVKFINAAIDKASADYNLTQQVYMTINPQ